MAEIGRDWRVLDGVTTAWFEAWSLVEAAALAERIVALGESIAVDVRTTGLRVRLASHEPAAAVSAVAHALGLTANPEALQQLSVVITSSNTPDLTRFWRGVLDYAPTNSDVLADPLGRDPSIRFRPASEPRPLRDRFHIDVVRPEAIVERVQPGAASGPYGVRHGDPDGNELDLVPGGPLGESAATSDWQVVFSAMASYRVTSPAQQGELVSVAAALAQDAGVPLLIDVRPGLVILDSAKDRWESDTDGLAVDFAALASRLQGAATALGAKADPELPRFVQLVLDTADIASVRAFWAAALGYELDRRAGVSDIYDPRRLNPVLVFQELDASETERRRQRNSIHVELAVPADVAVSRLADVMAAGGRLLEGSPNRWLLADPEGNELTLHS